MKTMRLSYMVLFFAFLATTNGLFAQTATPPSVGDGSSGNPYQIATLDNLYWVTQSDTSWNSHFIQTADVDASGSSSWDGGAGFTPIGNATTQFTGSYDGQAYKITGVSISRGSANFVGLFGYVNGGTITNVKLDNVTVAGYQYVGGLIGYQYFLSTVSTCYSSGSVTGSSQYVGGLIGAQGSATATNCYSTCSVTGTYYIGGLIGSQSYSNATDCYSCGSVTGTDQLGGLIGGATSSAATNCFYDYETSGQTSSAGGIIKSTAQMKDYLTFSVRGWPFKGINGTIWNIGNGRNNGYPYFDCQYPGDPAVAEASAQPSTGDGSPGNPYQIATLGDLTWITQDGARWNMAYKQTADIDATISSSLDGGAGFSPIGDGITPFTGSYDGQAYKITHLSISRSTTDYIGLFGFVYGATITNVKLDSLHITGQDHVGGLIGAQYSTSAARNCSSSGSVTGGTYVGGLIGDQDTSSTATNCYSGGSVVGNYDVGGLIGLQFHNSTATNCQSSGTVMGADFVGGLIGQQNDTCTVTSCGSSASVTGSYSEVGGLIGTQHNACIANYCYSSGSASCTSGSYNPVGGLIGYQWFSTSSNCYSSASVADTGSYAGGLIGFQYGSFATNCYSNGSVTGSSNVGGLIGIEAITFANHCFWDTTSSGQASSDGGTGKSTANMKNYLTFTGWSFKGIGGGTVWNIGNGRNNGYPYLDWQYPSDPPLPEAPSGAGTSGSPYQIATLSNLCWLTLNSGKWNKVYQQTADLDASTTSSWNGGAGFSPIGNNSNPFYGSYDGQTYKITGLSINRSSTWYVGLFGFVSGGTITNVKLDSVHITGNYYVGGLIGTEFGSSTVTNCYSNGSVTGTSSDVGGLIGSQSSSTATGCSSRSSVTGGSTVGGLIGYEDNTSVVTNCHSIGSVSASGRYVGGLIGGQSSSTASTCYSSSSVTCVGDVGGLIGYQSSSSVTNCYSNGSVTGTSSDVGGLIGTQDNASTATYCYSSGAVSGNDPVGGLVGIQMFSSTSPSCFWDMSRSGQSSSSGGTGESTADMKTESTFTGAGWNFLTVWAISSGLNNGYPYLPGVTDLSLAVEATSFAAQANLESVILTWQTRSEVNNAGFNVLRQDLPQAGQAGTTFFKLISSYTSNDSLKGMGTSSTGRAYDFTDSRVVSGKTYEYKIQSVSTNGTTNDLATLTVTVDVPKTYALYQNYPNPFNPSTTIRFDLKQASTVTLDIYNVLGQRIMEQNYGTMNAGRYNEVFDMSRFASGVYYYKLVANEVKPTAVGNGGQKFTATKKLLLVK